MSAIRWFHDFVPRAKYMLPDNDHLGVELPKHVFQAEDRTWSDKEYADMCQIAISEGIKAYANAITLARFAGLRIHEVFRIDAATAHAALKSGNLFVKGKNGKDRIVPASEECLEALADQLSVTDRGEKLFVDQAHAILASYLAHGLTEGGYFKDELRLDQPLPADRDIVHSIRQQSEGVYAVFHYLNYERRHGRQHRDWEQALRRLLDRMLQLQKPDGSFPRKYRDDHTDVDASGGSTPSATSTLVMAYKYFKDKRYLEAAKRTVDYLETHIIAPSDYFSSTLDANCEDKEAAISAVTATYYLAMVTKKAERQHYVDLCRRATYFACTWYYLWDVPFAQGQMLGDLGFQSRGWGNVSVENNHVDVFIFELAHIARWLSAQTGEQRFALLAELAESSMNQLLPTPQRLCGIGVPGFYPEVVQHTTWDYGRNGKGFYNDIFAPGWTIASLWELYSPRRTADFLEMK